MTAEAHATAGRVSAVVPVYNGSASLPELVARLKASLASVADSYEIVLVNDGSRDDSWQTIGDLARTDANLTAIDLLRNYGQHNALLAGIREATGDVIVTLDDDLQHPPEEIERLLVRLAEGYDVVYGEPHEEQHGFWRDSASRLTKLALRVTLGVEIASHVSAFRAFRTPLRDAFVDYQGPSVSIDVLLSWGTARFSWVVVRHSPRVRGTSNYTFAKLVRHALNLITGFSTWPLRIASIIGFTFTLFGLGILGYVLAHYFANGRSVPGFPFLASVIAIFGGVQLFALGIIGEYLARMHMRTMGRPAYGVRERIRGGAA